METMMKRLVREERGNVLILVLVLLVVGGLVLTPLLGLMSTGLTSGQVYEQHTHRLYAADAGVEEAIWRIRYDPPESYPYHYPEPLVVDNKTVDVTIFSLDDPATCEDELRYRILSTVITGDGGGTAAVVNSTTIDAYLAVTYMNFSSLLDYAIVSDSSIEIQPNVYVDGDVWLPDEQELDNKGTVNGTIDDFVHDGVTLTLPTSEQLSAYYSRYVEGAPDPGPSIDVQYTKAIGPCDRKGDLAVDNTGAPDTLFLEATVYVRGNLQFKQPGASKNYTIDLNGQTIFVEGSIEFPAQGVSISGSGCIIAVGDILFQPGIISNPDYFVLVMSIEGTVTFQPSGDFTGCVVGDFEVEVQPGDPTADFTLQWISPEGQELDFPMGVGDVNELPPTTGVSVESWEINPESTR